MNQGQIALFSFERQRVRTVFVLGVVWYVAVDVCKALGLENVTRALERLDDDEKSTLTIAQGTSGGNPNVNVVTEEGVFELIWASRKPEAERFKRWLKHEVLPMIRRYGYYAPSGKPMTQSKMLIEGQALFVQMFDGTELSERQMCTAFAEKIMLEYREMLMPLAMKLAHDWFYHRWARADRKIRKEHDPYQAELWSHYSVMRDGRERGVPREGLAPEEKRWFIRKYHRLRTTFRKTIDQTLRHDRAFVFEHNALHPETAFTDDELKLDAPDLYPEGVPKR